MAERDEQHLTAVINELKARAPYVPFRIVLTSGDNHLIESPGNLVEMKTDYFYAASDGESFAFLRKSQIAAVEQGREPKRSTRRKAS